VGNFNLTILELFDLLVFPIQNEKNWAICIIKKVLGVDCHLFQHSETVYSVHTVFYLAVNINSGYFPIQHSP